MSTTTGAIRITNDFLRDAPSDGSQYARKDGAWVVVSGSGGTSDHGSLTGLDDDDHTQYHNDTRGDARYYTKSQVDSQMSGKEDAFSKNTGFNKNFGTASGTVSEGNHTHSSYLTDAPSDGNEYVRKNGAWAVASSGGVTDHGSLTGLGDDDHTQYLLATGARAGASSQAQDFGTNGIKADAIIPHSTTGMQLGTSATQKVALFGATPVVQQDHVAHATGTSDVLQRLNELIDAVEAVGITATS